MANEMSRMKATVQAHMQRDIEAGGLWCCGCDDCAEMRSLVGVDKIVDVRPLVREIGRIEEQLSDLTDGTERRALMERYLALHDELANVMAK